MSSSQGYQVMEAFVDSLDNDATKVRLLQAIIGKKPFASFKYQIDNTEREKCFAFRRAKNMEWIIEQLRDRM
jgi:hypothetical protein